MASGPALVYADLSFPIHRVRNTIGRRNLATGIVPTIDLTPPRGVVGKSTVDAIRAGILYGYAGMVDGILARLEEELGPAQAIATGGLAGAVVPYCTAIDEYDDLLTLKGLRLIWERNR